MLKSKTLIGILFVLVASIALGFSREHQEDDAKMVLQWSLDKLEELYFDLPFNKIENTADRREVITQYRSVLSDLKEATEVLPDQKSKALFKTLAANDGLADVGLLLPFHAVNVQKRTRLMGDIKSVVAKIYEAVELLGSEPSQVELHLSDCETIPPSVADLTITGRKVDKRQFCVGFVGPFSKFLDSNIKLQEYLSIGDPEPYSIQVGDLSTPLIVDKELRQITIPWKLTDALLESIKFDFGEIVYTIFDTFTKNSVFFDNADCSLGDCESKRIRNDKMHIFARSAYWCKKFSEPAKGLKLSLEVNMLKDVSDIISGLGVVFYPSSGPLFVMRFRKDKVEYGYNDPDREYKLDSVNGLASVTLENGTIHGQFEDTQYSSEFVSLDKVCLIGSGERDLTTYAIIDNLILDIR